MGDHLFVIRVQDHHPYALGETRYREERWDIHSVEIMYPCRIDNPQEGDKIVFYDENYLYTLIRNEPLRHNCEYTIKKLIPGTGTTIVVLEEQDGWYFLDDFVRQNDILLRKHKLGKLYDRIGKNGVR
jgi:hypothetical protein